MTVYGDPVRVPIHPFVLILLGCDAVVRPASRSWMGKFRAVMIGLARGLLPTGCVSDLDIAALLRLPTKPTLLPTNPSSAARYHI